MDNQLVHSRLTETCPEFFCIAPFQSTRQNPLGRTSPCAFGAGEWRLAHLTPEQRWQSPELNELRMKFIRGERPSECHRCWSEEAAGKRSLRQRQLDYFPNDYQDFIRSGQWITGPKTAVFKTSNVCNLACRSCAGWDSNSYTKEGRYYAEVYDTKLKDQQGIERKHNRFIPLSPPTHMDFMQFSGFADNLEKIDFFGGEPLLNTTQLDLLEYLIQKGLSHRITLFYSTNCTQSPGTRLRRAWNQFKRIELSVSIDGTEQHFEYLRWPAKWQHCVDTLRAIQRLPHELDCEVFLMSGVTFSLYNMLQADEIMNWLDREIGNTYINMVDSPQYLSLHVAPEHVKSTVRDSVKNHEVLGYLDIRPHDPLLWKQFLIWTKRQDQYRGQDFRKVFTGLYDLISEQWDTLTDLSENNFYSA